jgi:hypothetical protein
MQIAPIATPATAPLAAAAPQAVSSVSPDAWRVPATKAYDTFNAAYNHLAEDQPKDALLAAHRGLALLEETRALPRPGYASLDIAHENALLGIRELRIGSPSAAANKFDLVAEGLANALDLPTG